MKVIFLSQWITQMPLLSPFFYYLFLADFYNVVSTCMKQVSQNKGIYRGKLHTHVLKYLRQETSTLK